MTGSASSGSPVDDLPDSFSARDAMVRWMQQIAPYGIFTTDAELRIRSWNDWLALHSGRSAAEVVGQSVLEVFPDVAARGLDDHFTRALAGEISVLSTALHKYLLPLRPPAEETGAPHMLQTVRIAPLTSGNQIVGTVTMIEDVTQRERHARRLALQQERDRLLSAALGVLLQSRDPLQDVAALFPKLTLPLGLQAYFYRLYNTATEELTLISAAGVLPRHKEAFAVVRPGEGLCSLCLQERRPIHRGNLQDSDDELAEPLRRMGFRTYSCFPLIIEGRLLGTLAFASSTHESLGTEEIECLSTIAQYVAIAMDRTQRERALDEAQRSLREHAENLETKVTERTARLHETIGQLETFSYTVAHDLRAPIRSLQGYCEILRTEYTLPPSGVDILDRLQRSTRRLDALTRDLLRFTRITRQQVELEPVDVDLSMAEIRLLQSPADPNAVTIRSPLGKVWAHRTLLEQCLANLLDNAAKFGAPGRAPRITVWSERRETHASPAGQSDAFHPATRPPTPEGEIVGELTPPEVPRARLRIWVEDNGIGIAPELHHKIFGIFERVSGLEHIEGTGIGLAIVARAVEQMKGTCGVASTVGEGSRFWLEFAAVDE